MPILCMSTKMSWQQSSEEKLAAKARRDAARAEIADRCGDSTEDDDAMDIDSWQSEDSSILIEFKDSAHTVSD